MIARNTSMSVAVAAVVGAAVTSGIALNVRAAADKVAFPEDYAKGVLYLSIDKADTKQYRDFYVTPAAIDALKKGQPVPSGTVITQPIYKAKLNGDGNPEKDASGRFIKGDLVAYAVMEKHAGWGTDYPEDKRNGEWEYQVFGPDKKVNEKANLGACFDCHKPQASKDYLFTDDKIAAAGK